MSGKDTTIDSTAGRSYRVVHVPSRLTITPRPLTVMADAQSRIYGDPNPPLTYQLGSPGLVTGDTLTGALATTATPSSPVGGYTISQGDIGNPNYAISFTGNTLTITPRAVTLADTVGPPFVAVPAAEPVTISLVLAVALDSTDIELATLAVRMGLREMLADFVAAVEGEILADTLTLPVCELMLVPRLELDVDAVATADAETVTSALRLADARPD
jgi:hypothetical protein